MSLASAPSAATPRTPGAAAAPPRWYAHPYNRSGYYRLALAAAPRLPRQARRWIAAGAARVLAPRLAVERAAVRRNLAQVHPGRAAAWLDAAVRRVFENFGVCFADLLSLNREPAARLWRHVADVGRNEEAHEALGRARGGVFITAHLGNWELAGRLLATFGRRVHLVMAPEQDPEVAAILNGQPDNGLHVVRRDSPLVSVELLAALRRGDFVAFQMDRATGDRGDSRVPFFGAPAAFPLGPFVMAAAARVPVVPAFCVLDGWGRYRLCVEPAFEVVRGEEAAGLARAVTVLERYVAAHWDQWFNFFDVWDGGA